MSIGSNNGLAPNRQQAIVLVNADPVHWRIYATLGGDELRPDKQQQTGNGGDWWSARHITIRNPGFCLACAVDPTKRGKGAEKQWKKNTMAKYRPIIALMFVNSKKNLHPVFYLHFCKIAPGTAGLRDAIKTASPSRVSVNNCLYLPRGCLKSVTTGTSKGAFKNSVATTACIITPLHVTTVVGRSQISIENQTVCSMKSQFCTTYIVWCWMWICGYEMQMMILCFVNCVARSVKMSHSIYISQHLKCTHKTNSKNTTASVYQLSLTWA